MRRLPALALPPPPPKPPKLPATLCGCPNRGEERFPIGGPKLTSFRMFWTKTDTVKLYFFSDGAPPPKPPPIPPPPGPRTSPPPPPPPIIIGPRAVGPPAPRLSPVVFVPLFWFAAEALCTSPKPKLRLMRRFAVKEPVARP